MKLRLTNDSVRLRLRGPELERLRGEGRLEDSTEFGADVSEQLLYSLEITEGADVVSAKLLNNRISVLVPRERAERWLATSEIGIISEQPTLTGKLRVVIEKDLKSD